MKRKARKQKKEPAYPARNPELSRRRFLVRLGGGAGVVVATFTFGQPLSGDQGGGPPKSWKLSDGTYRVQMPADPNLRPLYLGSGDAGYPSPIQYRANVTVATSHVAAYFDVNYLALYKTMDAALTTYTAAELKDLKTRGEASHKVLAALRGAYCAQANCGKDDIRSLGLALEFSYYEGTTGCSCGSVPLRD